MWRDKGKSRQEKAVYLNDSFHYLHHTASIPNTEQCCGISQRTPRTVKSELVKGDKNEVTKTIRLYGLPFLSQSLDWEDLSREMSGNFNNTIKC